MVLEVLYSFAKVKNKRNKKSLIKPLGFKL